MAGSTARRSVIADEAIERIKQMIISGELAPGQRLPPEKELGERLGISRNPLREAVRALATIHVLDVRQGDGTYVTSLEPQLLLNAMSFVVDVSRNETVLHLFELRRMVEPAVTANAAARIGSDELEALQERLAEMHPDAPADDLVRADMAFHRIVNGAAGNPVVAGFLEILSGHMTQARIWRAAVDEGGVVETIREHHAIYDALEARDPELARLAAGVHVGGMENWLRQTVAGKAGI